MKIATLVLMLVVVAVPEWLSAADFPTKPVALIAPTAPGGAVDGSARLIADQLSQRLGARFVVENRPGANGTIAAALVARARPDGYTLLFTQNTPMVVAPHTMKALSYNVFDDFEPVVEIGRIQVVLVAKPDMKVRNLEQFLAAAKAMPGKISYGSGGEGSDHHLAMELLRLSAGIRLHHVPYKAGPQAFADLLGGHLDAMFIAPGTAQRHVEAAKLVALGVSGVKPIAAYPGVPAIGTVIPGYEYESWFALFAPKGTPAQIVAKLNAELMRAATLPEVAKKMETIGLLSQANTPKDMANLLKRDYQKIGALIEKIGMAKQ